MAGIKARSGRKSLPKSVKVLRGTYRPGQDNLSSPISLPLTRVPRCPAHIQGSAKDAWKIVVERLIGTQVLSGVDQHALEAYCAAYGRWVDVEGLLREGRMVDADGKVSPYLKIANNSMKELRAWMLEFGATPSSRGRVSVQQPVEESDGEDWFGIRKN